MTLLLPSYVPVSSSRSSRLAPSQLLTDLIFLARLARVQGLYNHTRKDLRRLNDIINGLCADEVIEKTLVEQPSRKRDGNIVAVQCVRLLDENATGREKKKGKKGAFAFASFRFVRQQGRVN